MADSVGTKLLNVISKSKVARGVISSIVSRVLQFVHSFREKSRKKTPARPPETHASGVTNKRPRSKATIQALAFIMGASRASSIYCMSGRIGLAELQRAIVTNVLKREMKKERAKQLPKRSIRKKLRRLVKYKKEGTASFLLFRPKGAGFKRRSSKLRRTQSEMSHGTAYEHRGTAYKYPTIKCISLAQSVKDQTGMSSTGKFLLAGGAFLFIGISMLGTLAPGGLVVGLIVVGIVALLIPLIKRVTEFFGVKKGGASTSDEATDVESSGYKHTEDNEEEE